MDCSSLPCTPSPSLSMDIPRQESWGGLPLPAPGDFPHPGMGFLAPALSAYSLPLIHLRRPIPLYTTAGNVRKFRLLHRLTKRLILPADWNQGKYRRLLLCVPSFKKDSPMMFAVHNYLQYSSLCIFTVIVDYGNVETYYQYFNPCLWWF